MGFVHSVEVAVYLFGQVGLDEGGYVVTQCSVPVADAEVVLPRLLPDAGVDDVGVLVGLGRVGQEPLLAAVGVLQDVLEVRAVPL